MNVPAIEAFINTLNPILNDLIQLRDDLTAADRLWVVLDGTAKTSIHTITQTRLTALKAALTLIEVP